jgi:hypothetical protein
MLTFGLVAEGPTDHAVLKNIFYGCFDDADKKKHRTVELQPNLDATDAANYQPHGGWTRVFDYCKSTAFYEALTSNAIDFLIVQMDTDRSFEQNFDVPHSNAQGKKHSVEELMELVKRKFIQEINTNKAGFYEQYQDRIFFAISVHSLECWLLPIFYDLPKQQSATNNCCFKLSQKTAIECENKKSNNYKNSKQYAKISLKYVNTTFFDAKYPTNISLNHFVEQLKKSVLL